MGVVLTKEGGLPAGGFVNEYLGEMYCPWAWQERQVTRLGSCVSPLHLYASGLWLGVWTCALPKPVSQ